VSTLSRDRSTPASTPERGQALGTGRARDRARLGHACRGHLDIRISLERLADERIERRIVEHPPPGRGQLGKRVG
jgi:hypothetical protein